MYGMISVRDHLRYCAVEKLFSLPGEDIIEISNSLLKESRERIAPVKSWQVINSEERFPAVSIIQPIETRFFVLKRMNPAAEALEPFKESHARGYDLKDLWPGIEKTGAIELYKNLKQPGDFFYLPPVKYTDKAREFMREAYLYKLNNGEIMTVYKNIQ